MNNYKVIFQKIPWEQSSQGVKQKLIKTESEQIRLVKFDDTFIEQNWCKNAHIGYVLQGEMMIDFNGNLMLYSKGDLLTIPSGAKHKHKARIEKGKFVELLLFEPIKT